MTNERTAWGWGLASIDAAGNTLDVWYPQLTLGAVPEGAAREGGRRLMTVRLLRRPAVPRRRETAGLNPPMLIG